LGLDLGISKSVPSLGGGWDGDGMGRNREGEAIVIGI